MKDITIIGAGLSGTLLTMKLFGRSPEQKVDASKQLIRGILLVDKLSFIIIYPYVQFYRSSFTLIPLNINKHKQT